MLMYHPYNDTYHCLFRVSLLLKYLPQDDYDIEKIRILDFYLLFPSLLKDIRIPVELRLYNQYINRINKSYSNIPEPKRILQYLESQINYTLRCLVSYGMIDIEKYRKGFVTRKISDHYGILLSTQIQFDSDLVSFLTNILAKLPTNGKDGLKDRTGLLEYRYDHE